VCHETAATAKRIARDQEKGPLAEASGPVFA
jgi:hypothetical protein